MSNTTFDDTECDDEATMVFEMSLCTVQWLSQTPKKMIAEAILVEGTDGKSVNIDIVNLEPQAQPRHRARRVGSNRLVFCDPAS